MQLRAMAPADWPAVSRIYKEGIDTRLATFETDVPSWEAWDQSHHKVCRVVAESKGQVVGWVALAPVSQRFVYRGVAEHSIYIGTEARGQGVGFTLLTALIEESEQAGFWTLQSSTFPENKASIALHKKCSFRVQGYRTRIGQLDGVWRDTVMLERRSKVIGL